MLAGIGFVVSIGLLAIWTAFALRDIDRIISPTQSGWELYSSLGSVAILLLWVVTIRSLATKGSRSLRLRVATSVFNTAGLIGLLQASYVNNWNFFDRFAIVVSHLSSEFALLTVCSAFLYLAFGSYRQRGFVFLGAFGIVVGAWIATQAGYVSPAGGMFWGYMCIAGFLLLAAGTRVLSQLSSSMHPEDIVARGARKYAFSRAGFVVLMKWVLMVPLEQLTGSVPNAFLWPRIILFPVVAFASFPRTMWRAIIESHADPSRLRRLLNTALSPAMLDTWTTFSIVAVYYLVARTGVSGGQYERAFFVLLAGVTAARHVHLVLWSLPKQLRLRTIRPYAAFLVILVLEAVSVLLILAPIAADQPVSAIGIAELVSVRHVLFRPGEWLDVWRSGAVGTSALIVNGAFVAFQAGILGVLFRFREFAMTDEERVGRALRLLQFGVVDQAARILAGVRARTAEPVMAEAALSLSKGAPEEAKHRVGLDFQIEDVPVTTNGTYLVLMGLCASLPLRCETCGIVFRDAMNKNVPDAYLALPFGTVLLRGCSENVLLGFGEQETGGLGKFLLYPLASMVAADVKEEAGLRALSWIFGASLPASALNKVAGSCLRANTRLRIESEKKDYDSLAATLKKWCEAELPDIRTWLTELSEDFDLVVASNYLVGVGAIAEAVDQNVFQQIDAVLKGILERVKSNKVAAGQVQISRISQYH